MKERQKYLEIERKRQEEKLDATGNMQKPKQIVDKPKQRARQLLLRKQSVNIKLLKQKRVENVWQKKKCKICEICCGRKKKHWPIAKKHKREWNAASG